MLATSASALSAAGCTALRLGGAKTESDSPGNSTRRSCSRSPLHTEFHSDRCKLLPGFNSWLVSPMMFRVLFRISGAVVVHCRRYKSDAISASCQQCIVHDALRQTRTSTAAATSWNITLANCSAIDEFSVADIGLSSRSWEPYELISSSILRSFVCWSI